MAHVIEDLWYGNITPSEDCGVHDRKLDELLKLMHRHREALEGSLDQHQRDRLNKYADCFDEYLCELSARAFHDGFCFASNLWAETVTAEV